MIGYAIIGCGSIGRKRAEAIKKIGELVGCFDANPSQSEKLASDYQCRQFESINDLLENQSVQAIVVSTLHDTLTDLTIRSLAAGKYVLVEKPAARNKNELEKVIQQQSKSTAKVRVGLNHRYHPAIQKAKSLIDIGAIGKILFIRGRYGHGGRIGYEKEWRADPKISGGGELLDQGPHLIDLCHWMMGDVRLKFGLYKTYFWNMEVDDNAFIVLETSNGQIAQLHVSCTEWKNLFSLEIYGEHGKLDVSGLGGSYGLEELHFFKMTKEMGPPETTAWEYPQADKSFEIELREFNRDILQKREPSPGINDMKKVLDIISDIYDGGDD